MNERMQDIFKTLSINFEFFCLFYLNHDKANINITAKNTSYLIHVLTIIILNVINLIIPDVNVKQGS